MGTLLDWDIVISYPRVTLKLNKKVALLDRLARHNTLAARDINHHHLLIDQRHFGGKPAGKVTVNLGKDDSSLH